MRLESSPAGNRQAWWCDECAKPIQELRLIIAGKRTYDACGETCEFALLRRHGIAGEAAR